MRIFFFLFFNFSCFVFCQQTDEAFYIEKEKVLSKGYAAFKSKNILSLKKATKKIYDLHKQYKDSILLTDYYLYKALGKELIYANDSAFYYHYKSKKIAELFYDSLCVAKRFLNIATLQKSIKDYSGGEISAKNALLFLENIQAYEEQQRAYNILGVMAAELYNKDEASKYFNKSLLLNNFNNDKKQKLHTLNNLGLLHLKEKDYETAIYYFENGLLHKNIALEYPNEYCLLLENLAFSNFKIGNKTAVLQQYNEVIKIRESIKDIKGLCTPHNYIAIYYLEEKKYTKAKYHANKSLVYAKETHNNSAWLEALHILSKLHPTENEHLKKYIIFKDSIVEKERTLKNSFANINHETIKKEKENTLLKRVKEQNNATIIYQKQQKIIGWLLFLLGLLSIGFTVFFFSLRKKKLEYKNNLRKIEEREKERQLIAKSLHDEVAGDLRLVHQRLQKTSLVKEAKKLNAVKENVRQLSHKLSSTSFEQVTFKDQIVNLVADYFEPNFKIKIKGLKEQQWYEINNAIKRLLYLAIRECIQNCQKYAQATIIILDFSIDKKNVFLSINDNGIGFDTTKNKKGIGLQNLEERIKELKGTLIIDSKPNNGTKIYIQIPLNA